MPPPEVSALVEHLFRHRAAQMVSRLARWLGAARLDLAEEAVQDALVRALSTWPFSGVPAEPRGWLFQVARHRAIDLVRREVHPSLPPPARVALTLKTVGGFSVEEIAAAFLAEPDAIAQRLVRAKRQIRDQAIAIGIPPESELGARLESVLDVLYLLFNEGYSAHGGENLTRGQSSVARRFAWRRFSRGAAPRICRSSTRCSPSCCCRRAACPRAWTKPATFSCSPSRTGARGTGS